MDKIYTFIRPMSQKNIDKRILFSSECTKKIQEDIFKKKKTRYETYISNKTHEDVFLRESIKKKYAYGIYTMLKKQKLLNNIIHMLSSDKIEGISRYMTYIDSSKKTVELDIDVCYSSTERFSDKSDNEIKLDTDIDENIDVVGYSEIEKPEEDKDNENKKDVCREIEIFSEHKYHTVNVYGIDFYKMNPEYVPSNMISNHLLFTILYSIDVLYLNWMNLDLTQVSRNVTDFYKYITLKICDSFTKSKSKKMIEEMDSQCASDTLCNFLSQHFHIHLFLKNNDSINFYPTHIPFEKSKRAIVIIDNHPTYVSTSNTFEPMKEFYKQYFLDCIHAKAKMDTIRKLIVPLGIDAVIDIKNKKQIIDEVIHPRIHHLFS